MSLDDIKKFPELYRHFVLNDEATQKKILSKSAEPNLDRPGYVYGFHFADEEPKYIKLGRTSRTVEERKCEWERELGRPIIIYFQVKFTDCHKSESLVHQTLSYTNIKDGTHIGREWFYFEDETDILIVAGFIKKLVETRHGGEIKAKTEVVDDGGVEETKATDVVVIDDDSEEEPEEAPPEVHRTVRIKMVNLNTASFEELKTLAAIGKGKADKIIAYRQTHRFTHPREITNIRGIGRIAYEKNIHCLCV